MITYTNDATLARGDKQHNLSPCVSLLQRLWSTVLHLDESTITPDSHFFRLGGDSIDAMKLARLSRENNIELNVSTIISCPRLAELAHTVGRLDDVKPVTTTSSMQPATYAPFSLVTTHQQMLEKCLVEAARQCELSPSDITDMYPCTPMQSGLMALTAQRPDSYWVYHQFALPTDWTLAQAEAAGQYMVKQNEILRSRIVQLDNGECFNVVVNQDKQPPFTTAGGADPNGSPFGQPLFASHFEVNSVDGRVYMHWQVHHAIYDGWSARLMLQAFSRAYLNNPDSNAPSPSFSSFVRTVLDTDWTPSAKYWERTLHGYEGQAFPRLPSTTVARPTHRITHTSSWHGGASGITASSMIRAAWALVLTRYCGSGDVVFGAIVTGRNHPVSGIESMMGPTICTVPVRVRTPRDYTVRQFSQHVQEQSGEMSVHEQFGLPRIQALGALGPAQAAKFQSLVIVQPADLAAAVTDDGAEIVEVNPGVDDYLTYPVTLECFLRQGTVSHTLTIDETSISRFEAECLMQHFAHVFETLQDPGVAEFPASSVDLRSSEEAALLAQPKTPAPQAVEGCIHEMIFSAAAQCPQQPAVCAWDGELSYAELLWLSTTLAQRLISACVQPDTIVPIIHPKSRWTLVAMLAVLQAGGAFLLLDPALPFGRVQSQLDISGATTVLCGPEQATQFASLLTSKTAICLDEPTKQDLLSLAASSNDGSIPHSLRRAGPKHPAYVVMTSGTTGTPKGTVLEHRQVSSGFSAQVQRGLFRPGWRMLQFASYSFDPCIADMLGPLLVSGCVCIPRDDDRLTNLPAVLREFNVDIVELTPSIAMLLDPAEVPGLKVLRFGGEAVTSAHVERWADSVHVENSYGPSECCVTCTLTPRVRAGVDPANFGSAIGCRLWVVDVEDWTKLAPRGLVGELAIQGPIVGRGYLNDADAAARAFLPCAPWLETVDESPHSRVYMTGDLVRADADGTFVFVGRRDSQVKLRGQRIELGEIETVAGSLETVSEAIAMLLPGPHSSPDYPSSASSSSSLFDLPHSREIGRAQPTLQKLDRVFGAQLPGYMKPTFWIVVDQLPMSTSGKIDRKAVQTWLGGLAAKDLEQFRASSLLADHKSIRAQIQPTDETARQIRKLLDGLLTTPPGDELEDVQFASSGLDSIKSVGLVRSINQHFSIRLSMTGFLAHDTLAQVAREVDRLQHSPESSTASATHSQSPVVHHLIQDLDTLTRAIADSVLSPTPSSSIGNVFLTGATGYVGTMLLRTLLADPTVQHVYLLVRADSPTTGLRRVIRAARIAGWWDDQFSNHITVWPGDLAKPQIGLTDSQWASLSSTAINAIVHNGAMVNWFRSYAALKVANVDATAELLRVATGNPAITRFCFVSGGAQWDPEGQAGCLETTQLAADLSSTNGYGQSKLIAEQLVARTATMPGVSPATHFATLKPGLIIGGPDTGVANTDDFLWRLVKGCVSLGAYCVESDAGAGYMYMARGEDIGQSMLDGLRTETPYWEQKMLRGMRVRRFWDAVNTALAGQPLKVLDYEAWIAALREQVGQQGSEHPCLPVMHYIEQGRDMLGCPAPRVELLGGETGEMEREMEQAVIRNVQYLMEIGFFDSEPGRAMERADVFARSVVV
ncbi:acetyl-CoA synthetase-like protein [Aspergillus ruber CBS 135680]|uniref:Acetyl-CoA synthetase-like protein n=1 Tax=Aspergillus ruber (strain CBS 135680) TaxID=1388766 RepID=A0A017S2E7_ASPRC|nr:acetyl-CoA synthetase-like protein [Aspergillus ruber CBS 135680]EYE90819.1 acetyl-CoA synthetase-like protein [Aspergillus ruber CBS 135680]